MAESSLDAILIIFNQDFSPKATLINSILTKMNVRGQPYEHWKRPNTPVIVRVNPRAQEAATFMATAMVEFRILLEERFAIDHVEVGEFQATAGICGVVLTHWS